MNWWLAGARGWALRRPVTLHHAAQQDENAGEQEEAQVVLRPPLPAHQQPAEVAEPGEEALYLPARARSGAAAGTAFYDFPSAHWRHLRSTNGLERLRGEVKRRTRRVGAFPDRGSALRLVTTVALEVTSVWSDRRDLDMDLRTKPGDDAAKAAANREGA
jgi:hypothetical protein